ncbi:STAS domain-containing protein [Streptomyces sp. NPDC059352]|uniref:STAS domain-containing protein n=1 Tax=Streptomyces sp. NPDC059352 TaxID=3346810 RepID=UPI00367939B0
MEAGRRTGGRRDRHPDRFVLDVLPGRNPGAVVLVLAGELDHDTADPLRHALQENAGARHVVVDCSRLRFCDSTGLNLLLRARLRMLAAGGRLDLSGLRPPVDRVFEITGARRVFQVYEDADTALGAESAAGRPDSARAGGFGTAGRGSRGV